MKKGHQGDVQFRQISELPNAVKLISNRPIAYGEHSGHQHVLTGDVQMFEVEGRIVAQVGQGKARLQHIHESQLHEGCLELVREMQKADHDSHLLEPGVYEFHIQNAYNPYSKLMEKVID